VLELRDSPEFLALYGRLWHELSAQIARSAEIETIEDELPPELPSL